MNFESPQDVTVTVSNILGSTINTFSVKNNVHGVYPIDLSGQPAGQLLRELLKPIKKPLPKNFSLLNKNIYFFKYPGCFYYNRDFFL